MSLFKASLPPEAEAAACGAVADSAGAASVSAQLTVALLIVVALESSRDVTDTDIVLRGDVNDQGVFETSGEAPLPIRYFVVFQFLILLPDLVRLATRPESHIDSLARRRKKKKKPLAPFCDSERATRLGFDPESAIDVRSALFAGNVNGAWTNGQENRSRRKAA